MKTWSDIHLKAKDLKAIQEAVDTLKSHFPVTRVILHGSKVFDADMAESDIDLLVLTDNDLPWRKKDEIINSLFDIQLKHDVVFGVLIVSEDEWDGGLTAVLPIHHEVESNGVLV